MEKTNRYLSVCICLAIILFFGARSTFAQVSVSEGSPNVFIDFSGMTRSDVGTSPTTSFAGNGFLPNPTQPGVLNSNAWASTGWSTSGNLDFGGAFGSGTQYARGATAIPVDAGGIYAYTGSPASPFNPMLLIQPSSGNFAPGTLTLRLKNSGATDIISLALGYRLYVRNDQMRSSSIDFSYSTDGITYTQLTSNITPEISDALGIALVPQPQSSIPVSIRPGSLFYLRWSSADVSGSGSRDEIALDDISLNATFIPSGPLTFNVSPPSGALNVAVNQDLSMNFNHAVVKGAGNILIKRVANQSLVQVIDVNSTAVSVLTGGTVRIATDFPEQTQLYVDVPLGAFRDLNGIESPPIFGLDRWNFTTGNAVDWCNLQFPAFAGGPVPVYAQVYEPGVTEAPGADGHILAWIGVSPVNTNSNPDTWTMWVPATFNTQVGNNDEYVATLPANLPPGTYYYASRFFIGGGFRYGGTNNGFWDGVMRNSGVLTIGNASPTITSFAPTAASAGTPVVITGTNFLTAFRVLFGNVDAAAFRVLSPNTIEAIVGAGASGPVTVLTTVGASALPGFNFVPSQQPQTITFNTLASVTFGDPPITLIGSASSMLPVTYVSSDTSVAIVSGNVLTITGAGSTTITASQPGNAQFFPATNVDQVLTVAKAQQTVTIASEALQGKRYGDGPITLTGTASSSLPVRYTSSNEAIASVSGNELIINGAGDITLTLSQDGNADYEPAQSLDWSVHIAKVQLFATADNKTITYGDDFPAFTISYNGFIGSDDQSSIDYLPSAYVNIGAAKKAVRIEDAAKVALVQEKQVNDTTQLRQLIDPTLQKLVANDTTRAILTLTETRKEAQALDAKDAIAKKATDPWPGAGSYPIYVAGGGDNNYEIIPVNGTLQIQKAHLVITAVDTSKVYGDQNPILKISYSGFKYDDNATDLDTLPGVSTLAQQYSDVGVYAITLTGGSDNNYEYQRVSGSLTISKAVLNATADNKSAMYGDGVPVFTIAYSGFKGSDTETVIDSRPVASPNLPAYIPPADPASGGGAAAAPGEQAQAAPASGAAPVQDASAPGAAPAGGGAAAAPPPGGQRAVPAPEYRPSAGTYPIFVQGGLDNNYQIVPTNGLLEVLKASLTITAENKSKAYGDVNPSFTFSYAGFKYDDTAAAIDELPTASSTATQFSDVNFYVITVTGGHDNNYNLTTVDGTLTINKASLLATASDVHITYGGAVPELSFGYTGFKGDDDAQDIDSPPAVFVNYNHRAGTFPISVSGGNDNNYSLSYQSGNLIVGKAPITLTADNKTIVYGDPLPQFTFTTSNLVEGDSPADFDTVPSASLANAGAKDAGTYTIIMHPGIDDNYEFVSSTDGVLTISKRTLTVNVLDALKTYGDANPDFDLLFFGLASGDDKSVIDELPHALTEASQSSNAGTYPVSLTGGNDNNYAFNLGLAATLTIRKASLVVTSVQASKIYGEPNPQFRLVYGGFKLSEDASVIDTPPMVITSATQISDAGVYETSAIGGSDNNYEFAGYVTGVLQIMKAALIVKADQKTKIYGAALPQLTQTYSGFKGDDDVTDIDIAPEANTSATQASDVGNYPIVLSGGSDNNYNLQLENGVLQIYKANVTVTADNKTKAFGAAIPSLTFTYSGLLFGQDATVIDVAPDISTTATAASAPGTYDIVLTGGQDNNYSLSLVNGILTVDQPSKTDVKNATYCLVQSPANGATNVNYLITVQSTALTGAKRYIFELAQNPDFTGVTNIKEATKTEIQYLLNANTRYYARVRTDVSDWGPASTFTTGNAVSLSFLTSPANGTGGANTSLKAIANEIYGAAQYNFELNTNADFSGTSLTKTSATPDASFKLAKRTTYYARVSTNVAPGQWGPVTSFRTTDAAFARSETEIADNVEQTDGAVQYHVYPNPFRDEVEILVQTLKQEEIKVALIDVSGKTQEQKSALSNNYVKVGQGVATGVYLLTITTGQERKVIRIMKQ